MINTLPFSPGAAGNQIQGTGQAGGIGPDQPKTAGNTSNNPFLKIFREQPVTNSPFARPTNNSSVGDQPSLSDLQSFFGNLPLPGDVQLYTYPVTSPGSDGLTSGNSLQEGLISGADVAPQVPPPGGSGANGIVGTPADNQSGLPFPAGSSIQTLADKSAPHPAINPDPQPIHRNALEALVGEPQSELVGGQGKIVVKTLNPLQDADRTVLRISPPPLETFQTPLKPAVNQAFPTPLPFEQTPAGIAEVVQSSQNRLKAVSGMSSVLSDSPVHGKESSIGIPLDLLGEGNVSLTGDRSREGLEGTGKAVGIEPNNGQSFNTGMGGSSHSQSGFFHQSSSPSSSGQAVRMPDERVPDLPGPALQRLQMEVQLSDNNRVQIDVGVQHRQVYASLLMDQATLKNLAVQFVPQLEEQLTKGDMELQGFSAEVRDHQGEQESGTKSDGPGNQTNQRGAATFHQSPGTLSHVVNRAEDQGFHLVA